MQREFDESVRLRARRILREDGRVQMMRVDVQSRARVQRERGREPQNERNDGEKVEQTPAPSGWSGRSSSRSQAT